MFSTPAAGGGLLAASNMSDETSSPVENLPETVSAPRVRRISNPRPKKTAKVAKKDAPPASEEVQSTPFPTPEPVEIPAPAGAEWPEPEAESAGGPPAQGEGAKRKRRRRKGKGQAAQNGGGPVGEEGEPSVSQESLPRPQPTQQQPQQPQPQRPKIDPELLTKMAWKIYLAEVSEEGVALIGDNDAKDLSRRCFRLAEIFIEEQSRRR